MTRQHQLLYLEIHDSKDGMKIFKCGTRYDWYIIENKQKYKNTIIKGDDDKIYDINLDKWNFIPNSMYDVIEKLIKNNQDEGCEVIFSTSSYETRKKWVQEKKTDIYKYPLIHSTSKNGARYFYSSTYDKGHFGVKKIIFGDSGISNSVIDIDGIYGLTHHAIGIKIDNIEEGNEFKKILDSNKFKDILKACSWSNFMIDWRLFTYFKKNFYKFVIL